MRKNIIFLVCVMLFVMLVWYATTVAITYNSEQEQSATDYQNDDNSFIISFTPVSSSLPSFPPGPGLLSHIELVKRRSGLFDLHRKIPTEAHIFHSSSAQLPIV